MESENPQTGQAGHGRVDDFAGLQSQQRNQSTQQSFVAMGHLDLCVHHLIVVPITRRASGLTVRTKAEMADVIEQM